jgi:hypothetical protein
VRQIDDLFSSLARSSFHSRFKLADRERGYLERKGMEIIVDHARTFIRERLAPADPPNDVARPRCAITPSLLPSMLPLPVAGAACRSGTESRGTGNLRRRSRIM